MRRLLGLPESSQPFSLVTSLSPAECLSRLNGYLSFYDEPYYDHGYVIKASCSGTSFSVSLLTHSGAMAEAVGSVYEENGLTHVIGQTRIVRWMRRGKTLAAVTSVLIVYSILASTPVLIVLVLLAMLPMTGVYIYMIGRYQEILIKAIGHCIEAKKYCFSFVRTT